MQNLGYWLLMAFAFDMALFVLAWQCGLFKLLLVILGIGLVIMLREMHNAPYIDDEGHYTDKNGKIIESEHK